MKIENNKLYFNRTWKYLFPALRFYDKGLINRLNNLLKLGVGIGDRASGEEVDLRNPKLYILIQTTVDDNLKELYDNYKNKVKEFFEYIKTKEYFVEDYLYSLEENCIKHMVVIKLPNDFKSVLSNFISGKYSEMYSRDFIEKCFVIDSYSEYINSDLVNLSESMGENLEIKKVLLRDESYKEKFSEILEKDFGVIPSSKDFKEFDYKISLEEEMFNYDE